MSLPRYTNTSIYTIVRGSQMSRGNSLSDELELSSVLGDTRAYMCSPVWG